MGMENFEMFRKKTAETVKAVPKEVRRAVLESIKKNPEYENAKKLQDAKRGTLELTKTETLVNPENVDEVAEWVKSELNTYAEAHTDYVMTHQLGDMFEYVARYLAKRLNIDVKKLKINDIVDFDVNTSYPEDSSGDDGSTKGNMLLMKEKIFDYGSYSDGSSFGIDKWHDENLKNAIPKLIEYLKSQNKN